MPGTLPVHDTSLPAICAAWRPQVESLLDALDPTHPALAAVHAQRAAGDLTGAAGALLDHYRRRDRGALLDVAWRLAAHADPEPGGLDAPQAQPEADAEADRLRALAFATQSVAAPLTRRADGGIDWLDHGPRRDIEWAFLLNRHWHVVHLLRGWRRSGDRGHLAFLAWFLHDWLTDQLPRVGADGMAPQEAWPSWRNLEVGLRVCGNWPLAFFHGLAHGWLPNGTALLLLTALPVHGRILRHRHGHNPNHLAMELTGLAMLALCWPELRDAAEWRRYARATLIPQPELQCYPDGHQKELTAHYHFVALSHLEEFALVVDALDREPLPPSYRAGIERMWHCLAQLQLPDGGWPLSNDSDERVIADDLRGAAARYRRPDWLHVASRGAEGERPAWGPSAYLPWAGQLVSRSGFDADAHWSWFDCGPHGISGHQHYDKLHLSVAAHGRQLLVDPGRYTHRQDLWRQHFIGSYAHNVILVDGRGQDEGVEVVVEPNPNHVLLTDAFDFACAHFDTTYLDMQGACVHTRAVCYLRGLGWIVVDRMVIDRPRTIQPLWHFHPDCTVARDGAGLVTTDAGRGNLRLVPIAVHPWQVELVRGRTVEDEQRYRMWKADWWPASADAPVIQGWYAPRYDTKVPATCAVYRAELPRTATFAWAIVPARGAVPPVAVEALALERDHAHLRVACAGTRIELACALGPERDLALSDGSVARALCRVRIG